MGLAEQKLDPLSVQIAKLMQFLDGMSAADHLNEDVRTQIVSWVKELPAGARPVELVRKVGAVFGLSEDSFSDMMEPNRKKAPDFESLVPKSGWLADYVEFTRLTEPPTPYHFFAGAVALSTALSRNVYFRRGDKTMFPNLSVVLVGPSGIVRKTTACNMSIKFLNAIGANILADKLTPEAFIESFKEKESATGLIYAPEFAVFFGKQKYQEGMIPMLTALLDSPDVWRSGTIMRGAAELTNVGLTMLGASTVDWLQHAIPKDAFGGGFMSRLIFVVQERTPKCFPEPPIPSEELRRKLVTRLRLVTQIRGEFTRSDAAYTWWDRWYRQVTARSADNKHHSGYIARIPDQVWKLAMVLCISEGATASSLVIEERHFELAAQLLEWVEAFLPGTFDQLSENSTGAEQMAIVGQIKRVGGKIKHSELLRRNTRRMNADVFKRYITTLRDAGLVEYDARDKSYYLTPEGWKSS